MASIPQALPAQARLLARMAQMPDAIRLSRGDPDFATPDHIIDAVEAYLAENREGETWPAEGRLDLRQAIAERIRRVNQLDYDPVEEIVVTQGGQEAAFLMVLAAVGAGDEIIVPEPNYYSYLDAIELIGARPVRVPTRVEDGFNVDPGDVRAAISPRTRAILMVSPNNPSAAVMPPNTVDELVEIAVEHDLLILADDTYDEFLYDDAVHTSPASLGPAWPLTLTANTCSKTYAMTGWRLGWVAAPAPMARRLRALKVAVTGGTSAVTQAAALAALRGPQDVIPRMRAIYAGRRASTLAALDAMGLTYGMPMGGQFVLIDVRRFGLPSVAFCEKVLEHAHVLLGPGSQFSSAYDHCVRLAWLLPDDELGEGLERLAATLRAW